MAQQPVVDLGRRKSAAPERGVTFAVYAAIGTDPVLSRFPASDPAAPIPPIRQQALVRQLQRVAAEGANVCALVDVYGDATYLVEIPAFAPKAMVITSAWKQDMSDPHALAGFLVRAHQRFGCGAIVLSVEGHGTGYLPDLDPALQAPQLYGTAQVGGRVLPVKWILSRTKSTLVEDRSAPPLQAARPERREGPAKRGLTIPEMGLARAMPQAPRAGGSGDESPPLGLTIPELGLNSPVQPGVRLPMTTWGYGEALRLASKAGVPTLAVIHFANCFNGSFELLHTVAPYALYATGYANYDFFTAGETYPAIFRRLRLAGGASAEQLAQWFARENGALLKSKGHHPIIGATVALKRMKPVADAVEALGGQLAAAIGGAGGATARQQVQDAATAAQHYDTHPDPNYELQAPDQFVDLASFAARVQAAFGSGPVADTAGTLLAAVGGFWQVGDRDWPWMSRSPHPTWDFSDKALGLNIFFPDPARQGLWDWRTPYYLAGTPPAGAPLVRRRQIAFLADPKRRGWVSLITAYHRQTAFVGFLPAQPPLFPVFKRDFKPGSDGPGQPGGPKRGSGGTRGQRR